MIQTHIPEKSKADFDRGGFFFSVRAYRKRPGKDRPVMEASRQQGVDLLDLQGLQGPVDAVAHHLA